MRYYDSQSQDEDDYRSIPTEPYQDCHQLLDAETRIKIGKLELRKADNEYGVWVKNLGRAHLNG